MNRLDDFVSKTPRQRRMLAENVFRWMEIPYVKFWLHDIFIRYVIVVQYKSACQGSSAASYWKFDEYLALRLAVSIRREAAGVQTSESEDGREVALILSFTAFIHLGYPIPGYIDWADISESR